MLDVLIVGAGPTGLALAAQLTWFGTRFRIIDRALDRARETRALAMQARTLEVLDAIGLAQTLVERGRTSSRVVMHFGARTVGALQLGDIGAVDTRFPYILFVSQSDTEQVLTEYLRAADVEIQRGVQLAAFDQHRDHVECLLRDGSGHEEGVRTSFLVGCDGAHSFVRKHAGFSFRGGSYPQDFVLGDVEADGELESGAINSFVGGGGVAMFFPLRTPTTWRVIAMQPKSTWQPVGAAEEPSVAPLTLPELRSIVSVPTDGSVTVRDPAWLTHFRLHHRQVDGYRRGRIFLAGDAAHIHSPVGAQGMNTGIQDAWNLGWKLALVARGAADPQLLDSYEGERMPVGRFLLRYTDRLFGTFTRVIAGGPLTAVARTALIPRLLPLLLRSSAVRRTAFHFVSELGIHYRESPAVSEGTPRLRKGPRSGDRLPDARLTKNGEPIHLQRAAVGPYLTLLLCDHGEWSNPPQVHALTTRYGGVLKVLRLTRRPEAGALIDESGATLRRLGIRKVGQYLVRPDGYIAFRCGSGDVRPVEEHLARCGVR
jgi:2-polyprenyl-6-methoxyphenol hydroxylase-like FAD-dependent oxidoreductase